MTDLARLLLEARRVMADELGSDLAERGYPEFRPGHAALFLSIDRRSGSRLVDLAEEARVTKQAMMTIVDSLESRGYVRRIADPSDTRAKLVKLTARGRTAAAEYRRAIVALDQRTKRRLGERGYDALVEALHELSEPDDGQA